MEVIVISFQMNPFRSEEYKAWLINLMNFQAQVCCVVQLGDGRVEVCGDPQWGVKVLSDRIKNVRRSSKAWVPEIGNLELMDRPMGNIYKNHNEMKKYGSKILRHFIGPKTPFGSGECLLWEHPVPMDRLKYCKEGLVNEWNSPTIRLTDVVLWENFKVKSFGKNLKKEVMKIGLKWRELCAMIIEVGYDALNIDVDNVNGSKDAELMNEKSDSQCNIENMEILRDVSVSMPVRDTRDWDRNVVLNSNSDRDVRNVRQEELDMTDSNQDMTKKDEFKILSGSLKNICDGEKMTLQILEIIQTDNDISLNVSDGQNWVKCGLDVKFWEKVESGNLKNYDIIKNVKISGSFDAGNLDIVEMCKPKSIQLKVCKKIGNPVPITSNKYVKDRKNIRKGGAAQKMPRVEELFDVSEENR